jgi:hypothetical protein
VTVADAEVGTPPVTAVALAAVGGAEVGLVGWVVLEQAMIIGSKSAHHNDNPRRTRW